MCILSVSSHSKGHALQRSTLASQEPRTSPKEKTVCLKTTQYADGVYGNHCTCMSFNANVRRGLVATTHMRRAITAEYKGGTEESPRVSVGPEKPRKRGTIVGAVSLIVGTSIGSGILAVPQKTYPAGFIPSAISIIICWIFLVIEALLLAEINISLWKKRREKDEREIGDDLQVISLRTMAKETLGEFGGNLATVTYLFLAYTSMVAYASKAGQVLSHLIDLPESISGGFFTLLVALLIVAGGTNITDQVNQRLTFSMLGLLAMIEATAIASGGSGGASLRTISNWDKVPPTIPVIIFSLVYHDIGPVICAYLGWDLARIKLSIMLGSIVPLLSLLVWDDITLSLSNFDGSDPLDILKMQWSSMSLMVETFSLLAIGTSMIGTLLAVSQFFIEQLINLFGAPSILSPGTIKDDCIGGAVEDKDTHYNAKKLTDNNKLSIVASTVVILPTMLISTIIPNAFSLATDIAGGYCMMILYGILPPMMAWSMHFRMFDAALQEAKDSKDENKKVVLSSTKPILIGMGLFSIIIVMEQILQDLVVLDSYLFS